MPVLTDEQHQELLDKSKKANERAEESQRLLKKTQEENEETTQQRNIFLTTTIIFFALLIAAVIIYFVKPNLLFQGQQLSSDEVVVKKQTIEDYKTKIADAEQSQKNNENAVIIDGQKVSAFFAVQLGAFTKFNEPIVSPQYSLIKNIKEDGFTKYTIGVFDNVKDARNLRNKLIKLGFEDAFVGKYKNGKRLDIIE